MSNIMTLEDFFTLTEMKDGLTFPARVEELVAVMKKENDHVVRNVGDAMRQWSTVANVIAATDNKDCLDLFVRLDGLLFIDRCLKDAHTFSADASDGFIEEPILAFLQALEKLEIGNEKLNSSSIYLTVRDLISHNSNNIQDKAKALLRNLEPPSASGVGKLDPKDTQDVCDDRTQPGSRLAVESVTPVSSSTDSPDRKSGLDQHVHHCVGDNSASSACGANQQSVRGKLDPKDTQAVCDDRTQPGSRLAVESVTPVSSSTDSPDRKSGLDQHVHHCVGDNSASSACGANQQSVGGVALVEEPDKLGSHCSESDLKEVKGNVESSVREEECSSEQKSERASPDSEQGTDVRIEVRRLGSVPEEVNADIPNEGLPNKLSKLGVCSASTMPTPVQASSSLAKSYVLETDGKAGSDTDNRVDNSAAKSMSTDLPVGGASTRAGDRGFLMNCTITLAEKTPSQDDESCSNTSQDSPVHNVNFLDESVERIKHVPTHRRESFGFEPSRGCKSVDVTSKVSAMDLEYGMVDALEVACLVAKEVERQVAADYEEQFGSFPKKSSRGSDLYLVGSRDSFDGKKDQHADGRPVHESPVEKVSVEGSLRDDEPSLNSDNLDAKQKDRMDIESSQASDMASDEANSAEKGTSVIDLNLEICSEAADNVGNSVSNPVSVTASRAVAAPGLPASTLKFEGSLGWKGSAATSAFRPASPRRTYDGDRALLVEEATNASRQGHNFVIDLNLAGDGGCAPSGEPLVEPSQRRSEKHSFDLNLMSEDRDAPFSPSLMPAARNFDLNDRPLNFSDPPDLQPYLGPSSSHQPIAYVGPSDDSVISIMGAKVKKSTFAHYHAPISFSNGGRASEPLVDPNLARPGPPVAAASTIQYAPSPIYSYNGFAVGPNLSFPPPMYGPGGSPAYMVDLSGVSIVPQLMGAPLSAFQAPFAHQPAFTANVMGSLPGPNGASSSRSHLNFNTDFVIEGANQVESGGYRQFFPGQGRSAEMQLQPLFPGLVGGKRKEPDGGWERHPPPPYL